MIKMKIRKTAMIKVSDDAYIFLDDRSRKERGCRPRSEEGAARMLKMVPRKDGLVVLDDLSLGGGDGTYEGTWWNWSVDDLRNILRENGFSWEEAGEKEYIAL